jgi:hypothetical protein
MIAAKDTLARPAMTCTGITMATVIDARTSRPSTDHHNESEPR